MLRFVEKKLLHRIDRLQSHRLAPWVRKQQRRNLLLAIIIGLIFAAVVAVIILLQNRSPR
jgi:hypothetical protein